MRFLAVDDEKYMLEELNIQDLWLNRCVYSVFRIYN